MPSLAAVAIRLAQMGSFASVLFDEVPTCN